MENATKALIIAGAILITLIVISLGVYIFNKYAGYVTENADLTEQEISAFNNQITPYLGQNISGSQVNALISVVTAIDNNALSDNDNTRRVTVYYNGSVIVGLSAGDTAITYGSQRTVATGVYYTVTGTRDSNGLITTINVVESSSSTP